MLVLLLHLLWPGGVVVKALDLRDERSWVWLSAVCQQL